MTRRTAERRAAYLAAAAGCPTHRVLDRLGDRWVSLLLKELGGGPRATANSTARSRA